MDSIGDLKKDLNARLYERVSSPLYSTFIISWCVSNWRLFYVTIFESSESLGRGKFYYIVNVLYPGGSCWNYFCSFTKLYLWPAILTYVIIWWFPKLMNKAYSVSEKFKSVRKNEKHEIQGLTTVPGDVFLELKMKYEDQIDSFVKTLKEERETVEELGEFRVENERLSTALNQAEQKLSEMSEQLASLRDDFSTQQRFVDTLSHSPADIFSGFWESRFAGPTIGTGQETFIIREGYKYSTVSSKDKSGMPTSYTHVFDIDQFYFNRDTKTVSFRKVGVLANDGTILTVRLVQKGVGSWEGEEHLVSSGIDQAGFTKRPSNEKFGEPIKLTYTRMLMADLTEPQ